MVRRKDERVSGYKKMFGGAGEALRVQILTGDEELYHKGRLFSHIYLEPGTEIGWHIHHGDGETYYILKGRGEYSDNGVLTEVGPGDVTQVNDGEGHSLRCLGDETLEMIALILYS